jgi:hypothetical protein
VVVFAERRVNAEILELIPVREKGSICPVIR